MVEHSANYELVTDAAVHATDTSAILGRVARLLLLEVTKLFTEQYVLLKKSSLCVDYLLEAGVEAAP